MCVLVTEDMTYSYVTRSLVPRHTARSVLTPEVSHLRIIRLGDKQNTQNKTWHQPLPHAHTHEHTHCLTGSCDDIILAVPVGANVTLT